MPEIHITSPQQVPDDVELVNVAHQKILHHRGVHHELLSELSELEREELLRQLCLANAVGQIFFNHLL